MSILEEIKQGFAAEFQAAVPNAAMELQREGQDGNWPDQINRMTNTFMTTYGNTLVASAVAGLNNERMALMVAQEFGKLMTMNIVGGGSAFESYIKTALRYLFTETMRDVITKRLQEWHRATVEEGAAA